MRNTRNTRNTINTSRRGNPLLSQAVQNAMAIAAIVAVVFVIWLGFDAFFGLVGDLYELLDTYIWAFFAGIIAFFSAIFIVGLMIRITIWLFVLAAGTIGAALMGIASLFSRR